MTEVHLHLPQLHSAQLRIKSERSRFGVVCCGRRFGKSVLSRDRLVALALAGKPVAYFCPTYKMLADYWRETVSGLFPVLEQSNVQEKRLQLKGGGSIDMWSLTEPNAARGRKYAHVAIDEAAMSPRLGEAWQEVIRPTLADYQGTAEFYSTPRGRNFFWQLWQRGQDEAQGDWKSWQMPTGANPFIDACEIEAARLELPERIFAQEYLAQFIQDAGGVFRRVPEAATLEPQDSGQGAQVVVGIDWGRSHDFTCFVAIDVAAKKMIGLERFNQIDYQVQLGRLQAFCEKYRPEILIPEANSIGTPLIEQLQRAPWVQALRPFTTTNATKTQAIDSLALAFERGELQIINDPVLVGELQAYEMERLPSGLMRYGAPEGMHDDFVMSLALAWWGASRNFHHFIV